MSLFEKVDEETPKPYVLTLDNYLTIDPMIGMSDQTPHDFEIKNKRWLLPWLIFTSKINVEWF